MKLAQITSAYSYAADMPTRLYTSDFAYELDVSVEEASKILRHHFGVVVDDGQGWSFSQSDLREFRRQHPAPPVSSRKFDLPIGREILRRSLHIALGGSRQSGITPSPRLSEIFLFTNPKEGAKYGYDLYEGPQPDGTYSYTGHGASGPQVFEDSNKALRDATANGVTIRLFTVRGTRVRYVGAFENGDPKFEIKTIPGEDGVLRDGIIFKLKPIDDLNHAPEVGITDRGAEGLTGLKPWMAPDYSDVLLPGAEMSQTDGRVVSRVEFELQVAFERWLRREGNPPLSLQLKVGPTSLYPDFFVPSKSWVVEAKKSSSRPFVRMAIGQVLEYANLARARDQSVRPVILLPNAPAIDLQKLIASLGIILIVRSDVDFVVVEALSSAP